MEAVADEDEGNSMNEESKNKIVYSKHFSLVYQIKHYFRS